MKKMMLLGALLLSATAGFAQESRQDVSISAIGLFAPNITGNAVHLSTTSTLGVLASYRFMLTPRSALELNYSFAQFSEKYVTSFAPNVRIHTRAQEMSGAYVFNMNFRKFNPFIEAGPGAIIFTPIQDAGTNQLSAAQNTNIGALFGGGLAYELSPSFDIRAEYRGFVVKTPDFSLPGNILRTNRYEVISTPAIGIAYHF
jgi:outer membrane immunogenic protein